MDSSFDDRLILMFENKIKNPEPYVSKLKGNFEAKSYGHSIFIKLGEGMTKIFDGAFSNFQSLRSVTIPNQITEIGAEAFKNCQNLSIVKFPNNLKEIGKEAFRGCKWITEINISSEDLWKIGMHAFDFCSNLKRVSIKTNSSLRINYGAFNSCRIENATIICKSISIENNFNPFSFQFVFEPYKILVTDKEAATLLKEAESGDGYQRVYEYIGDMNEQFNIINPNGN